MNSHPSSPGLEAAFGYSSTEDECDGSATIDESANPSEDAASILPLFLFGLLAALGTAYLLCQLSDVYIHSWTEFLIRSIGYIALTAAAGTTGTWVLWSLLSERPSLDFLSLSLALGVSWVFLPCIVLFYRDHSIWMLIAMPTATAVTAVSLKRLFAGQNEVVQAVSLSPQPVIVPLFSGISPARTRACFINRYGLKLGTFV
jgi:hypothetical protein